MTDQTIQAARSAAEIKTEHASRYLQQLCKHFAHKLPVTFDPNKGRISFPFGDCDLTATDSVLTLSLTTPDASTLPRLQEVVANHLVRFAFREEMTVDWRPV